MIKKGYIIIDDITEQILCKKGIWESYTLDEDGNYLGEYKLFSDLKSANKTKSRLEKAFLKNDDDINFRIIKVNIRKIKVLSEITLAT